MDIPAIRILEVSKSFKKHQRRKRFLTMKSKLIRDIWTHSREKENVFWALKNINFDVHQGETLGIIGANGSGKSSLLKVIAGILKATHGAVEIEGRMSALIELGAGFHPEISGRENIYINGIMLGLSKREIHKKFNQIVDFADIWDFIDNPVRTYSSGMFMRLGFSVAVHVNPDILLIDEVLAVGDQAFFHKCLERIFDFKRRKKTIVIVSHDLGAIEKLCSRVVWLSKGEQKLTGPPKETIDAYLVSIAKEEEERFASQHELIAQSLDTLDAQHEDKSSSITGSELDSDTENGEEPNRWGTRDVEITKVKFQDFAGREKHVFQSGDQVEIYMEYYSKKKISDPVFGVGFYLPDGTWCYGTNTQIERINIKSVEGSGWIKISFPSLDFVENTYLVSIAVHSLDETPYDYHNKLYQLAFRSNIKDVGIMRLAHEWQFCPEIRLITETASNANGE